MTCFQSCILKHADCREPIVFTESYQAVIILLFQISPQRAALEVYHKGWGVSTIIGVTAAGLVSRASPSRARGWLARLQLARVSCVASVSCVAAAR